MGRPCPIDLLDGVSIKCSSGEHIFPRHDEQQLGRQWKRYLCRFVKESAISIERVNGPRIYPPNYGIIEIGNGPLLVAGGASGMCRPEPSHHVGGAAAIPSAPDASARCRHRRKVPIPDIDCLTQSPRQHSLASRGVIRRDAVWVWKPDTAAAASRLEGSRRVPGRCSGPISRPIRSMKPRSANWDYLELSTGLVTEDLRAFGVGVAPPVSSDRRALAAALR